MDMVFGIATGASACLSRERLIAEGSAGRDPPTRRKSLTPISAKRCCEMAEILSIDEINSYYGKSHILFDVSFKVNEGETLCLMGRNGAGKSTTFRSIVGVITPKKGRVVFKGRDITNVKTFRI